MKKKVVAFCLSCVLLVSLFAGCGGSGKNAADTSTKEESSQAASQNTVAQEKVTINFYSWESAEENNPIFKEFMEKYPDIEVKLNLIPDNNDKTTKLDVMSMGGGDIDVRPLADGDQFQRGENGMLLKLDDLIKRDNIDMKKNFGSYELWAKFGDSYYCYPTRASIAGVFYNKDMFDKAGIAYPTNDWTLKDYLEIAKKLTTGSGDAKVYGTYNHTWGGEFNCWAMQKVGYYTSDGMCNIDDPLLIQDMKLRKELDDQGIQKKFSAIKASKTIPNIEFFNGKCAMAIAGSWMVRDMKDKTRFPFDFKVGIVGLPRVDETVKPKQMKISVSGLGIPSTSKHQEEAWKFVRYYVEQGSKYIAKLGNMPVYLPAYDNSIIETYIEGSGLTTEDAKIYFDTELVTSTSKVIGPAMTQYSTIINEQTELYFTGSKSLEDTINTIKSKVDDEINKEKAKK